MEIVRRLPSLLYVVESLEFRLRRAGERRRFGVEKDERGDL